MQIAQQSEKIFHRGVVAVAIFQALYWSNHITFLFSGRGFMPRALSESYGNGHFYIGHSLFHLYDNPIFITLAYGVFLLTLFRFLINPQFLVSGFCSYVLLISFLNRNMFLNYGGSDVLRVLFLFDVLLQACKQKRLHPSISKHLGTATLFLLRSQMIIIYIATFLVKFSFPAWRNGTAFMNSMNNPNFSYFDWCWLMNYPSLSTFLTTTTLLTELILPLLLIHPVLRPFGVIIGCLFHGIIGITMEVGYFCIIMCLGLIGCLIQCPEKGSSSASS